MRVLVFIVITIVCYPLVDNVAATQPNTSNNLRVCEWQTMKIECPQGSRITILSALYGRKLPGNQACPHPSIKTTSCESPNSLSRVKALCQGKRECSVAATNGNFLGDPCVYTFKYLEVNYRCDVPPATSLRVCEWKTMKIQCPQGSVINIDDALYGRMLPGSQACPHPSIKTTSCKSPNSLSRVKAACQGKGECSVAATNGNFLGDPCVYTFKYLEVKYRCEVRIPAANSLRVCEWQTMKIQCPPGSVINIKDALYGRKLPGNQACPHSSIKTTSCKSPNSLSRVKATCQGKGECNVAATNTNFLGDPCVYTFKYLEVEYNCVAPGQK